MKKKLIYWLIQAAGWSAYGLFQVFLYTTAESNIDKSLLLSEGLQVLVNISLTHGFRSCIIYYRWLNLSWPRLLAMVLASVILMGLFSSLVFVFFLLVQNGLAVIEISIQTLLAHFLESLIVFFIWSLIYLIYLNFERYNASLKYQAAAREIELSNLKAQLNPHFIFNALNSIRALVDEDPDKSKTSITKLSNLLRNSLNVDREKLVPLGHELKIVRDYLDLEGVRYEERLKTKFTIDPKCRNFVIPPLMLQTLVENGIKHGIAKLTHGGLITISAYTLSDQLYIELRNSGQLSKGNAKFGLGLTNTSKRLALIYGHRAGMSLENESKDTVLTKIWIPHESIGH